MSAGGSGSQRIGRRAFAAACAACSAELAFGSTAGAMGRTPFGGRLAVELPWPTGAIDPHDLRDAAAALFGGAIADTLYGLDASGSPYPTLAAALPARETAGTIVRLREGLRTAQGAGLDARDVVASVERSRARGGATVLVDVPKASVAPHEPLAAVFSKVEPGRLARALASPLCALLPRSYSPSSPDATGAFRCEPGDRRMLLTRNLNAARGPSFLDAVEILRADDLQTSLRAFEAERTDIGWMGLGLHEPRRNASRFDLGAVAWIVLATGADAAAFGAPGVAQRLADALPPERLAHLGLGSLPPASGDPGWGGPATELLVEDAPHLVEVARAVAPILSRPGHEVTVAAVSRAELARRRARGAALAIDLVRPVGSGALSALVSLAMADDLTRARDLARHPPRLAPNASPRTLTATLRVGVLGEVRVAGGVVADVVLARNASGESWDLGSSFRRPRK